MESEMLLPNALQLPIGSLFIENKGQIDSSVNFYIKQSDSITYFSADAMTVSISTNETGICLKSIYVGSNPFSFCQGKELQQGKVNYLKGNSFEKHITNIRSYRAIYQHNIWPGIDLAVTQNENTLKTDWIVQPGISPSAIQIQWEGIEQIEINEAGDLVLTHALGEIREKAPYCYQEIRGQMIVIPCDYVLEGTTCSFRVGAYNSRYPLIIDPPLQYSTFLGGTSEDEAYAIFVDHRGSVYVNGATQSANFPTTPGAFQSNFIGTINDAYVAKLSPDLSTIVYCTFLGGSVNEGAGSITVDLSGQAFVLGHTWSPDFPVTPGAFQTTYRGGLGLADVFVCKLSADGSSLVYSTFLGGTGQDLIHRQQIAIDTQGNAYVSGTTTSADFPVTPGAIQSTLRGTQNIFVTKISASGATLVFSTYLGGSGSETTSSIAIDGANAIHVSGTTSSQNFPVTANAFQPSYGGGASDGFVCKISPNGTTLEYSTYLGGNQEDKFNFIAVDARGIVYVGGQTFSADYPTTADAFQATAPGASNAMVSRLDPTGGRLLASTFIGGSSQDSAEAAGLRGNGMICIVGWTRSTNFPVTPLTPPSVHSGGTHAFVSELNLNLDTLRISYTVGGTIAGESIATSLSIREADLYVAGYTNSATFPTTANAVQPSYRGGTYDAFIFKARDVLVASYANMTVVQIN